jgi:hypothetical protein
MFMCLQMAPPTPSKSHRSDMTTAGKQALFEKMQELFNDPASNSFVEISGNSPTNPKYFDINLKINGQVTRHLCKVIVSDAKSVSPFSMGDVIMSTEISNKLELSNISFSLVHEKVSEIVYLKGLFDDFYRLNKRSSWYDGYYTKSTELPGGVPVIDKVADLEAEIARMKPMFEYATKVLTIPRPPA